MIHRIEALKLLSDQHTPESLLHHALAAEAIMRALAGIGAKMRNSGV